MLARRRGWDCPESPFARMELFDGFAKIGGENRETSCVKYSRVGALQRESLSRCSRRCDEKST